MQIIGYLHGEKKMNLDHYLRLYIRMNSCHVGTLNVNFRTTIFLEENIGDPHYHEVSKIFLNRTENIKKKIDKLYYIKIRNFCSWKVTIKRVIRQATEWEMVFADICLTKDLYIKYIKNFYKSKNTSNRKRFELAVYQRESPNGH